MIDQTHYEGIGLMSGTSLDGIDLAYCRFSEKPIPPEFQDQHTPSWSYDILQATTLPLGTDWKDRLNTLDAQSAVTFARTHIEFGHFLGKATANFIRSERIQPQFIASHGQTIFHQPAHQFTTQIGDGETMASYLKVPLVTQFRNKDVALGGQGAPLVPFGERHLFPQDMYFLNLGGIANLARKDHAFDVCVCNMALNWLANQLSPCREHDPDGAYAAAGQVIPSLLADLERIPWYQSPPPKSLGKEWFESTILPILKQTDTSIENKLATYCVHVANRIVHAVASLSTSPSSAAMLVSGGGVHNKYLIHTLKDKIRELGMPCNVTSDPLLTDYKEAMIFAFLGLQTLLGRPNTLTTVTGARQSCIGGSIHLPPDMKVFQLPLTPRSSAF